MSTAIFIKTCLKDIDWLKYCIRSIIRYTWDFDEIVVVADYSCKEYLKLFPFGLIKVFYVSEWDDGRIQQQYYKLRADQYCDSDNILFVDSDCLFTRSCSPQDFMKNGMPILGKTLYEKVGDAQCWKKPTESFLGWTVEYEYMRWIPWICKRSTLIEIYKKYPGWEDRLRKIKDNMFSEFNVIGAYIDRYESDGYYITDTDVWEPEKCARQFWSWGGLTPEVMIEIKQILHLKT